MTTKTNLDVNKLQRDSCARAETNKMAAFHKSTVAWNALSTVMTICNHPPFVDTKTRSIFDEIGTAKPKRT